MKIFITGGTGFIGSHLTKFLINQGHNITIYDNFSNSKSNSDSQIKIIEGDILDHSKILNSMKNMDLVIHLAAQISVIDSISNPDNTLKINVEGTHNILDSCVKNNIKNFIAASTAAVFGHSSEIPLTEEAPTNPISPYGKSKLIMEKEILEFSQKHNLNSIILRFFNLYGVGQSLQYAGVITKFMKNIHTNTDLEIYGNGNQTRDFIHISDAINSFDLAIKNIDGKIGKIYNVGTGTSTTILELAKLLLKISRKNLKINFKSNLDGNITHSQTSIDLLRTELGFVPKIKLHEGLKFF